MSASGQGDVYGVLNAPNAHAVLGGQGDWYDALIVGTLTASGNGAIHYDRSLGQYSKPPGS